MQIAPLSPLEASLLRASVVLNRSHNEVTSASCLASKPMVCLCLQDSSFICSSRAITPSGTAACWLIAQLSCKWQRFAGNSNDCYSQSSEGLLKLNLEGT